MSAASSDEWPVWLLTSCNHESVAAKHKKLIILGNRSGERVSAAGAVGSLRHTHCAVQARPVHLIAAADPSRLHGVWQVY